MADASPLTTVRLTELTECGGCAAKWGGSDLRSLLAGWQAEAEPEGLLVGLRPFDDAAVVRLADGVALVSTVDFFPPLVDDPDDYGAIAAANACSDVYAMGGDVVVALNVAAFPEHLDPDIIARILAAAAGVVREAGGVVAGGHTIRAPEPIFGLAVQGIVRPGAQFTKAGARPGDALVLSKPLGTGLALASGDEHAVAAAIAGMRALNRDAAAALRAAGDAVHAVTDVTGFGLAGHAWEVAEQARAIVVIDGHRLPAYPGALDAAVRGVRTGGDARNRAYLAGHLAEGATEAVRALVHDPQTSGGLLAAVDPAAVDPAGTAAAGGLAAGGFAVIGRVEPGPAAVELR
ncbi:MAG TPA: selenide, water dikinase SelD [Acidimicrobiales bacterium]|nr:selenide, water dikinase SelD [Acidimicrobiales bacterium]